MPLLRKAMSFFQSSRLDVTSRFELLREAVFGTMSEFYMARDRRSGEIVGLKLLDTEKSAAFEARFKGLKKPTEGEITSQLTHPRIVRLLEHGLTTTGQQYLVLEFLEGAGLNALILGRSEQLNGKRVRLIRQMAEAVDAAHKAGFIHHDVCPRNFLCSTDLSSLKLIDFGLTVPATKPFKAPGNRTGTPSYMAPEVIRRRPIDERIDVFSLGVSAYQLLTFELPWPSHDTTGKVAMLHDTEEPVPILDLRPNLNPVLAETITRSLAVNPNHRPASADEFVRSIRLVRTEEAE